MNLMCFDREALERELKDYPELMTYGEACTAFGISYNTLLNKIKNGLVVAVPYLSKKPNRVSKSATIDKIECEQLK